MEVIAFRPFRPQRVDPAFGQCGKVDQRHLGFLRDALGGGGIGGEARDDMAVLEGAARHRGDQHRLRMRHACDRDEMLQVRFVIGDGRVAFGLGLVRVVMTELDQQRVARLERPRDRVEPPFRHEALGAATRLGAIVDRHLGPDRAAQHAAPARQRILLRVVILGGRIAGDDDTHRARLVLRGGAGRQRQQDRGDPEQWLHRRHMHPSSCRPRLLSAVPRGMEDYPI
ncbi:hypothetical protein WR25_21740 [Diploscapter pachys]|uniref:Uncharacterized protein n=1 Tax=Diploscapter pachys TaxID=2018661 RepID=A0A2A2JYL5_9BILA|nr:hypothetical protein WR25_21740 [Diploscapter pachys]